MRGLIFPEFTPRLKKIDDKQAIFDIVRKKFIILTPEEIVRQHLIHFFINQLHYPKSMISVEDGMNVNSMMKRSDVVVYNREGKVFLAAECKSTKVKLTQKSMNQLSVYNQHYQAEFLVLTNGLDAFICKMNYDLKKADFVKEFPAYQ